MSTSSPSSVRSGTRISYAGWPLTVRSLATSSCSGRYSPVMVTRLHWVRESGAAPPGSTSANGRGGASSEACSASLVAWRSSCLPSCHGASSVKQAAAKAKTATGNASQLGCSRNLNRTIPPYGSGQRECPPGGGLGLRRVPAAEQHRVHQQRKQLMHRRPFLPSVGQRGARLCSRFGVRGQDDGQVGSAEQL